MPLPLSFIIAASGGGPPLTFEFVRIIIPLPLTALFIFPYGNKRYVKCFECDDSKDRFACFNHCAEACIQVRSLVCYKVKAMLSMMAV